MSKRPWFPLYVGDMLADTMNFDAAQFGGYLKILCHYWITEEPMTIDEMRVASGLSKNIFQKSWPLFEKKFVAKNEKYFNRRMRDEIAKATDLSTKRAEAGSKGGQANASSLLKQLPTQLQSQLHIKEKSIKKKKNPPPKKTALPDFIDRETWEQWEQFRKEIRKPLKPTTLKQQIKQLEQWHKEGHDCNQIIITSIRQSWTGLFPPSEKKTKSTNGSSVEYVPDDQLAAWAARNGAPGPKHTADYNYDKYRDDLKRWEQSR